MFVSIFLLAIASVDCLTFTGDVEADMPVTSGFDPVNHKYETIVVVDNDGNYDVGVPPNFPYPYSGWDIRDVRVHYAYNTDQLSIGINCFGICGDADGDGVDGRTSSALNNRGGQDVANFGRGEGAIMTMDLGSPTSFFSDGVADVTIGYPASYSDCPADDNTCFGAFQPMDVFANVVDAVRVALPPNTLIDWTRNAHVDLEWTILSLSTLRQALGLRSGTTDTFAIAYSIFHGSFVDDGVGEDRFPRTGAVRLGFRGAAGPIELSQPDALQIPSPQQTGRPTPFPTPPTPSPTPRPSPSPTPRPSPSPTPRPSPSPTPELTPELTPEPTPEPTPKRTKAPKPTIVFFTPKPTPGPTPATESPTPEPTPEPAPVTFLTFRTAAPTPSPETEATTIIETTDSAQVPTTERTEGLDTQSVPSPSDATTSISADTPAPGVITVDADGATILGVGFVSMLLVVAYTTF